MRGTSLFAVCFVLAAPLFAGEFAKTEVFGAAGWGHWWDNEGAPVTGIVAGGGIGRRLLPQFAVEGEAMAFRGTRGYFGPAPNYRARGVMVTGNGVLYFFRRPRAHVFALLGAGVARSTVETTFGDYHNTRSQTGFIANAGAGVKLFVSRRVSLRPEVRLTAGSSGSAAIKPFSAELRFSLGLGYQW